MTDGDRRDKRSYDVTITDSHAKRLQEELESLSTSEALRVSSELGLLFRDSLLTEDRLREVVEQAIERND